MLRSTRVRVLAVFAVGVAVLVWMVRPPARTAYVGGPVFTMDAANRVAGGVAVRGDRIAAVGSDAELRAWAETNRARVVELDGRALLPGFVDAHSHFPAAGVDAIAADLDAPPIGTVLCSTASTPAGR
jgi:predicted amidohydrolase YtcJ